MLRSAYVPAATPCAFSASISGNALGGRSFGTTPIRESSGWVVGEVAPREAGGRGGDGGRRRRRDAGGRRRHRAGSLAGHGAAGRPEAHGHRDHRPQGGG